MCYWHRKQFGTYIKELKHVNMVVKFDMAKAYDRISWIFLTIVMRKLGFGKRMIDMVWRLLSNNWYSILINGQIHGFFQSSRGVQQGDPLYLILFIIGVEVLSRTLNLLNEEEKFIRYGLPRWSGKIHHLSYADDTIFFCSANRKSVKMMMEVLKRYEIVSGKIINLSKSFFYLHDKAPITMGQKLKKWTGIGQGIFPFTYLGCPIFYGRKKKQYFESLVKKVSSKIHSWKSNLLLAGGKFILIKHMLQSVLIYHMSVMSPQKELQ